MLEALENLKIDLQNQVDQDFEPDGMDYELEFIAVMDEGTCPICKGLHGSMVNFGFIALEFPYAEQVSDNMWYPNVHPECRCVLIGMSMEDYAVKKSLQNSVLLR